VGPEESIVLVQPARRFVSRGGLKLEAALDRFGVDVAGRDSLDAGASTGGFTHCLLSRGASRVIAVDVGYGQLAWSLRQDPRVVVVERTNVRDLRPEDLPYRPEVVTADLSFISLRLVIPALARCASDPADLLLLVKPQFEAGRDRVGDRGVVSDPAVWHEVLVAVGRACVAEGLAVTAAAPSPLLGPAGNVEFFLHVRCPPPPLAEPCSVGAGSLEALARQAVEEAVGSRGPARGDGGGPASWTRVRTGARRGSRGVHG
jgi:23S rRNA (cytidine1920-2'-O)/16S rRNA (cytidine1409-2'-O)-methyltransferase